MQRPTRDSLVVLALLAPVAFLCLPSSINVLGGDPYPVPSASGWLGLLLVPLAILTFVNPGRPRVISLASVAALGLFATLEFWFRELSDVFEARRALLGWLFVALGLAAGSSLKAEGRRRLSEGLVLITLLLSGAALFSESRAGAFGNSGATSQVALAGAILGAWFGVSRRGMFGWVGILAALVFGVHVVLTPVYASLVAFVVGLGSLFLSAEVRNKPGRARALAIFCILPLIGLGLAKIVPTEGPPADDPELVTATATSGDTGGFEVRRRIWTSLAVNLGDSWLMGMGPGQFQAAYPPLRDPREIEASRHGVCLGGLSEVEHAHSGPLQVNAELGRIAGLEFALLLGLFALAALGRIRSSEKHGARGLAAAALGALAVALVNAAWSFVPVNALVAFALFGCVQGQSDSPRIGRVLARALAVLLVVALPWSWAFVDHGAKWKGVVAAATTGEGAAYGEQLEALVEAHPDSFAAQMETRRRTSAKNDPEVWSQMLNGRPHSVEVLERKGLAEIYAGDFASAIETFDRALELSPTHPRLLQTRIRIGWSDGDPDAALPYLERLRENGCLDDGWMRSRATECLLLGRIETGIEILGRLEPDAKLTSPELLSQRAREATDQGAKQTGEALRTAANTLWAREHAQSKDYRNAVRLYRQAVAASYAGYQDYSRALLAEQAAAEWRAGRTEDSFRQAERATSKGPLDARSLAGLPEWAREAWNELNAARAE